MLKIKSGGKMKTFDKKEEYLFLCEIFKKHGAERILDIGCGSGELVRHARKKGFFAAGFDVKIDNPATDTIFCASADKIAFKPDKFDTFVFRQSMHHIKKETQKKLFYSLLKKGKRFFVIEATIGESSYEKLKSLILPEREMRLSVLETLHKIQSEFKVERISTYGCKISFENFEHFYSQTIAKYGERAFWNKEIEKIVRQLLDVYKGNFIQQVDIYLIRA